MKKIISLLFIVILIGCNDSNEGDGGSPNITNVENVKGNIPDTTEGVTLNQPMEIDSSRIKDTIQK